MLVHGMCCCSRYVVEYAEAHASVTLSVVPCVALCMSHTPCMAWPADESLVMTTSSAD